MAGCSLLPVRGAVQQRLEPRDLRAGILARFRDALVRGRPHGFRIRAGLLNPGLRVFTYRSQLDGVGDGRR